MVIGTKPKASIRDEVRRRVRAGMCLQCEAAAEKGKRGLCSAHYARFYRSVCGLGDQARIEREAKEIRDGRILGSRQGQRGEPEL